MLDFDDYLHKFEQCIIVKGIEKGVFTRETYFWIFPGTMTNRLTERLKGDFIADKAIVVSYYGATRRSSAFHEQALKVDKDIKRIKCYLVHFNQVRFEDVHILAPDLISAFYDFKQEIIKLRWRSE